MGVTRIETDWSVIQQQAMITQSILEEHEERLRKLEKRL